MLKMRNLIFIIGLYTFIACNTEQKSEKTLIRCDLSQSRKLDKPEIIFSFDDRYPVEIIVKDSIAFIIDIKNNTSFIALNVNKKAIVEYFGNNGLGPNDVIEPQFISSVDTEDFIFFQDVNSGKMMKIHVKSEDKYKIDKFIDYPSAIFPSTNMSLSSNFFVYRKIDMAGKEMFYIYNQVNDSIISIDFFPNIKEVFNKNYYLASHLALNELKNRIIAGFYFLDMFSLYDLAGKRLKSVYFTDNYIPAVNESKQRLDLKKGYAGMNTYPTKDFCYLLRRSEIDDEIRDIHLIQTDWNGNIVKSYIVPDIIQGFCIDETNKKMYAIKHSVTDDNEIFYIISWQLPVL
jgi:hypothetical protein